MNTSRRSTFRLNRSEGKFLGVCAGIADHFGIDVTLVRVATVVAVLIGMPFVILGYFVAAFVARDRDCTRRDREDRRDRDYRDAAPRGEHRAEATRQRLRDLDARMQKLEEEVVAGNSSLAREIDALR